MPVVSKILAAYVFIHLPMGNPHDRISMREIARRAGVSHVTVARSLQDSSNVSIMTRNRIKRLAAELGYHPDPLLNVLADYRTHNGAARIPACIAWINAWPQPEQLRAYREFYLYWKSAHAEAEKLGFRLEEFRLGGDISPARLHQILQTRGIRAILLPPHEGITPSWHGFPWEEYVVVRFSKSIEQPVTHLVAADDVSNTLIAFQSIRERGYRKIGFVTREANSDPLRNLYVTTFLAIQDTLNEADRMPVFNVPDHPAADLIQHFGQWVSEHRPDAILSSDPQTRGLLDAIGLRIPDDIGLAATSILDGRADSGIDQQSGEIGRVGVLLLNSLISDGARGIPEILSKIVVTGKWVNGRDLPRKSKNKPVGPRGQSPPRQGNGADS